MHQTGLRIALRTSDETLDGVDLTACEFLTLVQWGKDMTELLLLVFVIDRLTIHLDETVELHDLTLGDELLLTPDSCLLILDGNRHRRLLNLCVSHLTGNRTLPDQFVQTLLLARTLNLQTVHIGRTDGLVSLLSTFRVGVVLTRLAVFLAIETCNLLLAGT